VLVRNGRIAAIGSGLAAGNATVVDAQGQPLTPALFGGITEIGVEEVSGESSTVDAALALGSGASDMQVRPEFDVTLAYNPESILVPVRAWKASASRCCRRAAGPAARWSPARAAWSGWTAAWMRSGHACCSSPWAAMAPTSAAVRVPRSGCCWTS
jgi:hypothetical protein